MDAIQQSTHGNRSAMKAVPEPTLQDTIRETCGWLAGYGVCLACGWIFHDDMSYAIQWPAITMLIGFLGGLSTLGGTSVSLPVGFITLMIISFATVYVWPEYVGSAVSIAALSTSCIGVTLGTKCGSVLRRAIHRHKNDRHDADSVLHSQNQPSQHHEAPTTGDIPARPESTADDQPAPASQAIRARTAEQYENQHQTEQRT